MCFICVNIISITSTLTLIFHCLVRAAYTSTKRLISFTVTFLPFLEWHAHRWYQKLMLQCHKKWQPYLTLMALLCGHLYHRKNIGKAQGKHSRLAFWLARNGLAPTTNKYCYFNATLTYIVIGEKCNLQCAKFKIHNGLYSNASFSIRLLQFTQPPEYPSLHLYIYENVVCIQWGYWHRTKFATGPRITIWTRFRQKCITQRESCHFGILAKTCFISINHVYFKFWNRFVLNGVNTIYMRGYDIVYTSRIWKRHYSTV